LRWSNVLAEKTLPADTWQASGGGDLPRLAAQISINPESDLLEVPQDF
jgi:hypothetical protein